MFESSHREKYDAADGKIMAARELAGEARRALEQSLELGDKIPAFETARRYQEVADAYRVIADAEAKRDKILGQAQEDATGIDERREDALEESR